ncbi:MAG: MarR family transcriptional regulator [Defluviicoccus sp.]|nr:MarR family transcriptional regulator [Defluviicoccus sp.]MDE0276439.1 MarR family transcriptional regulator [Defluviicoccus sp.]
MSECARIAELVDRLGRMAHGLQYTSGLNPAQWEALRFIARANRYSRSPGAIARYLGTTRGTVSQTLIALEAKGYIRRLRCDSDRRALTVDLTDTGRALIENDPLCLVLQAADALDCEAQSRLADGLDGLVRAVQTAKGMPEFGPCLDCVHFCPRDEDAGSCHCALTDEPIPAGETVKICVEFQSAAPA